MVERFGGSPMKDPKSYLQVNQINSIVEATRDIRYKRLFFILANTGRRVSEIARCLKRADIDFEKGLINFTILKRKRPTKLLLPVNPKVLIVLKKEIEETGVADGYIFPMSRQRIDKVFKKAAEEAGIISIAGNERNKPHVHLLRHSFAIQAAMNTTNVRELDELQRLMGHASPTTTMYYVQSFNPTGERKLLERMWGKKVK